MSTDENNSTNIKEVSDQAPHPDNKKMSYLEMSLKFKNKVTIDYTDIDYQKGEISPKLLFKKRKVDNEIYKNIDKASVDKNIINNINNMSNIDNIQEDKSNNIIYLIIAIKIHRRIKQVFDNYLDLVHDSYFTNDQANINYTQNEDNSNNINMNIDIDSRNNSNFKFSSLDLLLNPLRKKFIFESWSPYEIALFECCISKYGKNFDLYPRIIKTKNKDEILSFYYYWKQTKFYKTWKSLRYKKNKLNNK
jgi:hypothetical protein